MGKEPKSRTHACPQCDYKTGNVSHLKTHVRTVHEQRRDHACPQCDAAFGRASNLTVHVRTMHEQRRDHACPQCDAAFGQAVHLRRHVRTVHEQRKDHACPHCAAAFGQAGHRDKHAKVCERMPALVQRLHHSTMSDVFEGVLCRLEAEAKAAKEAEEAKVAEAGAAAVLVDNGDTEKVPEKICSDECLDEPMECTPPVPLVAPPQQLSTPPEPPQEDWRNFNYPEGREGRKAFAAVNRMHHSTMSDVFEGVLCRFEAEAKAAKIVKVYECELDCGFRSTDFAAVEQHEVSCAEKV